MYTKNNINESIQNSKLFNEDIKDKIKKAADQLIKGIEVESEHQGTYDLLKAYVEEHGEMPPAEEFFTSIAYEHLKEDGEYYDKLEKMETQFDDKEESFKSKLTKRLENI